MNLFFDPQMDENKRRQELYRGSIFVYSPSPSALKLCTFARELVEEAFHPYDPRKVHETMPVEKCVEILAELKPRFIHHPKSKEFITGMLAEHGCDQEKTYFDVPRLRTAFPSDYLASGIAYAFHPHRDVWYSAPMSQINWWMPVYEIYPENSMAFHPRYWDEAVRNNSNTYNYYAWNRHSRQNAAQHVKADAREQPRPQVPLHPDPQLRVVARVGGVMLFSAAQLHSTVPNTCGITRFSVDFRTVHLDDVWAKAGAINIDSAATGTTMRDYIRATDYTGLPDEAVVLYNDGTEVEFVPSPTAPSRAHAPMSTSTGRTADDNHAVTQSTKKFNSAQ
ncbi:MAG: hypothetical protein WBR26_00320 [Candidatus Acidiferrum sp.]